MTKKKSDGSEDTEPKRKKAEAGSDSGKKRGKADAEEQKAPSKTLEELVLNYQIGKYSAIPLISLWAKELRLREEHRHLTPNEILELAMREVLGGTIGWKELKKALANGAPKAAADALSKLKKEK